MTTAREAERQALLISTLLRQRDAAALASQTRHSERFARGFAAYRANAGALAERALAAAYPVVQQLIGEDSFAALARDHWQHQPPQRGDIAQWGNSLAAFVAAAPTLADEPYLADVARLEWAIHEAASATDDDAAPYGFEALQNESSWPGLRLLPRAGTQLIVSAHPIQAIVDAHTDGAAGAATAASAATAISADRFDAVRTAFAAGTAQSVLVWRDGWKVRHAVVPHATLRFTQSVLRGDGLLKALKDSGDEFDFEGWLIDALQKNWLAGATCRDDEEQVR